MEPHPALVGGFFTTVTRVFKGTSAQRLFNHWSGLWPSTSLFIHSKHQVDRRKRRQSGPVAASRIVHQKPDRTSREKKCDRESHDGNPIPTCPVKGEVKAVDQWCDSHRQFHLRQDALSEHSLLRQVLGLQDIGQFRSLASRNP